MTDQVLNILKLALLGLLYLFFGRVLWAVWSEVRTPKQRRMPAGVNQPIQRTASPTAQATRPTQTKQAAKKPDKQRADRRPTKGRRGRVGRLVILEPRSRRGTTIAMAGEITLGRDQSCTITIDDDSFVSQRHFRVYDYEGQPMIEDLGSTNGTFHNGNKISGSKLLHPGDRIQVGTTVIEAQ
jgi:pSer/pThr/pTyr-binding forkhead associated (FHA) protein